MQCYANALQQKQVNTENFRTASNAERFPDFEKHLEFIAAEK